MRSTLRKETKGLSLKLEFSLPFTQRRQVATNSLAVLKP